MFQVIFNTYTQTGNIGSVAVRFNTEIEAETAIKVFTDTASNNTATRLYRHTLQFKVEWGDMSGKQHTTYVSGYSKKEAVDGFLQEHNIPYERVINVTYEDRFADWDLLK